jgi:hypothetical protein
MEMTQNKVYNVPETAVGKSVDDIIEMSKNKVYGVPLMHSTGREQDPTTTEELYAEQQDIPAYEYIETPA